MTPSDHFVSGQVSHWTHDTAAAPASAMRTSCSLDPPDTPIAPTVRPSHTSGTPPPNTTSRSVFTIPCSRAGSDSSSRHHSPVGRPPKDETEYALSWANCVQSRGARSMRAKASRCPALSAAAMQTSTDSRSASAMAAEIARWAAAIRTVGAMTKSVSPSARAAGSFAAFLDASGASGPVGRRVMRPPCEKTKGRGWDRLIVGCASAEIASRHRQRDAGDVGGLIGGEEEDGRDLFLDGAVALHERRLDGLVDDGLIPGLLLLRLGPWATGYAAFGCLGAARCRGHHPDTLAGVLERQRGGQRPDAALGRGVRHPVDAPGGHRADVDDRAATLLEQMRENSAAAPEGREQRAADLRLDLVLAVVGIWLGPDRAAHVVDQDVDPAETLVSLGHDPRAVVVPLEVSPDGDRLGAGGVELVAQLGDEFRAVDEGDAAALLGHPRGDPLADALRRPGHHGHLAVEAARMDHRSSLPR